MSIVNKLRCPLVGPLLLLALVPTTFAQRQMEKLGRGVVAVRSSSSQVYVGWRLLGNDPDDVSFNLYRVRGGATNKLNGSPFTTSCNYVDTPPDFSAANAYFVRSIINGVEQPASASFVVPPSAPVQQYLSIPLTPPPGGTAYDGVPYTYNANDCSVGDVDGDGEYEIILKWDPTNSKDNSQSGFTGNTYLDCYKLDGTRLWRINLGPNIRSGAHYMDFMVFDYDGDGKAEMMCRTAPGSIDGQGNYVGGAAKWQNANGTRPSFSDTHDYRFDNPNANTTNGYVLAGPEFLTVFNGLTGEEMATATFNPHRDPDNNNDNPTASRINAVWGDSYGNRLDRFLAGVAYCDGVRPSAIFCRGYYTRAYLTAWDWRNGQLSIRWKFNSDDGNPANLAYRGQGAHSLSIGDLDGDGRDEITYGACAIDDNGKGLYSTGLGHGDAEHVSDMDPYRPGLETWFVHESPSSYGPDGLEMHDSKTGEIIFALDGQNSDVGRGVAMDIDPRYPGYEMWGSRPNPSVLMNSTGAVVPTARPSSMNFACWWDGDLLREILDGTTISKWNWTAGNTSSLLSPAGLASNNSTKSTPCLSADLFGDWREEVIWRTADNLSLRIYTTTIVATNRLYTLMHDPQYRCAIAWQNTGYNQPPHPGFNIGPDMYAPPVPPTSTADLAWRGGNTGNNWAAPSNWFANGIWTNDVVSSFVSGNSVLFDLRASNNTTINISSAIVCGDITVYSSGDFTFTGGGVISGAARLVKAGPGKLTLANTNTFTGITRVSGGELIVNGSLDASAVVLEARGDPWGRARIGGVGRLGQGLTIQSDRGMIVGPGTNAPGTFTITNGLTELGGVLNQFDLSNDPTGGAGSNDVVQVFGNVVLTGTNAIVITQTGGYLGGGVYPLITYSGTLTGGLTNLTLAGNFLQPVALTNPPGMIALTAVIPAAAPNAPTSLVAGDLGAFQINLAWTDNSTDENEFQIERSQSSTANFSLIAVVPPDTTTYQDIGLLANTTYYYRVRGTNLAGFSVYSNANNATTTATPPSLTWKGDGSANVWDIATTANWVNGGSATPYADGSFVTFDNSGSNTPAINLISVLSPGTLTVNSSKSYTFGGNGGLTGSFALGKSGSGSIAINTTNTFAGGINLTNGSVVPGSAGANSVGLGSGPVRFYGGTLEFAGWTGSTSPDYGGNGNALIVPAGQTGTIRVPQRFLSPGLGGALSGGGTLNLQVKYVRGDISGNWSGFAGTLDVSHGSSGTTVDDFRIVNAAGFPNARLQLNDYVLMYSRAASGAVIPIGQFTAGAGAVISAGFGTSVGVQNNVTWRVGGLDTSVTNAGLFQGTTALIKEGSGTWTLTGNNTYTGTTMINGGTFQVDGDQSAATGNVTVNANGRLAGNGIIGGNTTVSGTLAPGSSIGTLTFNQNLTLNATSVTQFEISKNPFGNDKVVVSGNAVFGGALDVVNVSVELLEAGDNFSLFSAGSYSGAFAAFDLPALEAGLAWNVSRLAVDGHLWVVSTNPPVINTIGASGGNFSFSGNNGTPNWNYSVLTSTNLALPLAQWSVAAAGQFDAVGNFSFNAPVSAADAQRFYVLQAQ